VTFCHYFDGIAQQEFAHDFVFATDFQAKIIKDNASE
jgi:hypothetical protein